MALRNTRLRFSANIWPGFVDAMTALLLILFFVLSIFMIVQFALRETISGKDRQLTNLSLQLADLAEALGIEQGKSKRLATDLAHTQSSLFSAEDLISQQIGIIAGLTDQYETQTAVLATLRGSFAEQSDTIVQLNQQIAKQSDQIVDFEAQVANLRSLSSEQSDTIAQLDQRTAAQMDRIIDFETQVANLLNRNAAQSDTIAQLNQQSATQRDRISDFETQVAALLLQRSNLQDQNAALLADKEALNADVAQLNAEQLRQLSAQEKLELALSTARDEIDAQTETARLAAAKREALEALIADLKDQQAQTSAQLDQSEADKLAEAAAAAALAQKLQNADTELSALTLALEAERKKAEDTLTLLAAAQAAKDKVAQDLESELSNSQRNAGLLAIANQALQDEQALSAESQRKVALLTQQSVALRRQLEQLQALLDESAAKDRAAEVQLENLGQQLNAALARVAVEERKRADAEAKTRELLEKEANDLRQFRSEFFGRLRNVLGGQEGVRIVGDRFVFSSEVLFAPGSADLGERGKIEIETVANIIDQVRDEIPPEIDWVLQVDGHTDRVPIRSGLFADNWALSQARALSVVRFLIDDLGFPPDRLTATGFGEFQPIDPADTPEAYATNRRIELKFTEK